MVALVWCFISSVLFRAALESTRWPDKHLTQRWLSSVSLGERFSNYATRPQQFLYFLLLPQGHGSLRPTLGTERRTGRSRVISPAPSPSAATPAIAPTG